MADRSPPPPKRADARANRRRILEAAKTLFAADGLSVSLDEIARHAGVGPGTVHRHFASKDSLIAAVALGNLEALVASAQGRAEAKDPVAALRAQLLEMVAAGDVSAPLKRALTGTPSDVVWSQTDVARQLRRALEALLVRAQHAGGVRGDLDAEDLTALLAGCYAAIQRADVPAESPVGRRLTEVLLNGLSPVGQPDATKVR